MVNFKEKASNVIHAVERKALPVVVSASTAMTMMTVNALAAEDGSVDYSSLSTTITSAFKTIITNCVDIATAIIPLGVGLIAMGKMWDVARKFFNKTTK